MLNAAYFALSLTDPALAIAPLVKNSNANLRALQTRGPKTDTAPQRLIRVAFTF